MQEDEFRREIRIDPSTGERNIVLPNITGDISRLLTSTKGEKIDTFSLGNSKVTVISPEVPLFLLEETQMPIGDGITIYDRVAGYGADERFAVNSWSPAGLELLIEAFKSRSATLQAIVVNGRGLGQTYPYALFDPYERTLTGVLLASREIAPRVMQETQQADIHLSYRKRRIHHDIHKDESISLFGEEHRVVAANEDYIAIVPFSSSDQHTIYILPVERHVVRLTELTRNQSKGLAELIYRSVLALQLKASEKEDGRFFNVVNIAFHSAPVIEKPQDKIRFNLKNNPDDVYDFHVEIKLGTMPTYKAPYVIPESGWSVVTGRPKQIAERLRELYHHP